MKVYALRLKDKYALYKSSSGGAFTAISDIFLKSNCAIVSAIYNYETNQNEFRLYTSGEARDTARGSKYMQAYPLNSFKEAENWIKKNNKELLFVGTGCQADGFKMYAKFKKFEDKISIVDIICHGTPSPSLWKDYVGEKIEYLDFKDKRNGWNSPFAYVVRNGKEVSISNYLDMFYNRCALRPSCYECPYASTKREVDITIGDFWGIEKVIPDFYKPEGNSLVLVHTKRGQDLFEKIKDKVEWVESDIEHCLQPNLIKPTEKPLKRERFWKDYKEKGISYITKKYTGKTFMTRAKYKIGFIKERIFEKSWGGVSTRTFPSLWREAV